MPSPSPSPSPTPPKHAERTPAATDDGGDDEVPADIAAAVRALRTTPVVTRRSYDGVPDAVAGAVRSLAFYHAVATAGVPQTPPPPSPSEGRPKDVRAPRTRQGLSRACVAGLRGLPPAACRTLADVFLKACAPEWAGPGVAQELAEVAAEERATFAFGVECVDAVPGAMTCGGGGDDDAHASPTLYASSAEKLEELLPVAACLLRHGRLTYPQLHALVTSSFFDHQVVAFLKKDMKGAGGAGLTAATAHTRERAEELVDLLYRQCPPARPRLNEVLVDVLRTSLAASPTHHKGMLSGLRLLAPVAEGLKEPVSTAWERVLLKELSPLYRNEDQVSEGVCAVSFYAAALNRCSRALLRRLSEERHFAVCVEFFEGIVVLWDRGSAAHCAEMIACFAAFLEEVDGEVYDALAGQLLPRVAECVASDNADLAGRALDLFQRQSFVSLLSRDTRSAIQHVAPALVRDGKPHWSQEVNQKATVAFEVLSSAVFALSGGAAADEEVVKEEEEEEGTSNTRLIRECCTAALQRTLRLSKGEAAERLEEYHSKVRAQLSTRSLEATELARQRAERDTPAERLKPFPAHVNNHLHFVFGKDIGRGSYSVVRYSKRIEREISQSLWREYATKVISKQVVATAECLPQVHREIELMGQLRCAFVSPLYASFEDAANIYIVTELCAEGDLFSAVFERGAGTVSGSWAKHGMAEMYVALEAVHTLGYLFGDMKTENILVGPGGHLRLCDFGSCKPLAELEETTRRWQTQPASADYHRDLIGTLDFLPPEVVTLESVSLAADWWSFGVVLVQLLCGFLPFAADDEEGLVAEIATATPKLPPLAGGAMPLILGLLRKEPAARLDAAGVRASEFFSAAPWDRLHELRPPALGSVVGARRPLESMADPRYTPQRKYSMLYTGGGSGGGGGGGGGGGDEGRRPILEVAEEAAGWASEQPAAERPWVPLTNTSVGRFTASEQGAAADRGQQGQQQQRMPSIVRVGQPTRAAQVGNALGDYCTTAPFAQRRTRTSLSRPGGASQQRRGTSGTVAEHRARISELEDLEKDG